MVFWAMVWYFLCFTRHDNIIIIMSLKKKLKFDILLPEEKRSLQDWTKTKAHIGKKQLPMAPWPSKTLRFSCTFGATTCLSEPIVVAMWLLKSLRLSHNNMIGKVNDHQDINWLINIINSSIYKIIGIIGNIKSTNSNSLPGNLHETYANHCPLYRH